MVKNTLKLGVIFALLILPLGMPDDIIFVPAIIAAIGFEAYLILAITVSIYLYNSTEGKTLSNKLSTVRKEMKQLFI